MRCRSNGVLYELAIRSAAAGTNRADAQGLCGAWRHISEWVWLAGRAGLPTPTYRQTSTDQIDEAVEMRRLHPVGTPTVGAIVVGDRVFGPSFPPEIREACFRLAQLSKTALLGIGIHCERIRKRLDIFPERHPCSTCAWAVNHCLTLSRRSCINQAEGS